MNTLGIYTMFKVESKVINRVEFRNQSKRKQLQHIRYVFLQGFDFWTDVKARICKFGKTVERCKICICGPWAGRQMNNINKWTLTAGACLLAGPRIRWYVYLSLGPFQLANNQVASSNMEYCKIVISSTLEIHRWTHWKSMGCAQLNSI